jgi:hypothetical protein
MQKDLNRAGIANPGLAQRIRQTERYALSDQYREFACAVAESLTLGIAVFDVGEAGPIDCMAGDERLTSLA